MIGVFLVWVGLRWVEMSRFCHWKIENSLDNSLHRVMHASLLLATGGGEYSEHAHTAWPLLLSNGLVGWSYIVCSCFCFSTKFYVHIVMTVLKHKFEEWRYLGILIVLAITGELRYHHDGYPYVPRHWAESYHGVIWLRLTFYLVDKVRKIAFPSVSGSCVISWRPEKGKEKKSCFFMALNGDNDFSCFRNIIFLSFKNYLFLSFVFVYIWCVYVYVCICLCVWV